MSWQNARAASRPPGKRAQRGQALTEFALVLPMFALFVFGVIQLSLIFVAYYSETTMTRLTARWLAVNKDATDLQVAQYVQGAMLPGLVTGTPTLVTAGSSTTDTTYTVGDMTVQFSPCYNATGTSGACDHNQRVSGATAHVQMNYNVRTLLFFGDRTTGTARMGSLVTRLPTTLPSYRVSIMIE
jgi:Flp pilus assembly protein TadG